MGSPYCSLVRGEFVDYEEFKENNVLFKAANPMVGLVNGAVAGVAAGASSKAIVETGLDNNQSIMPVRDAAGNPLPQTVNGMPGSNLGMGAFSVEGLVIHSTSKKDSFGNKIKIKSPEDLKRNFSDSDVLIYGRNWVAGDGYCMDTYDPYFRQNYKGSRKRANPNEMFIKNVITAVFFLLAGLANMFYEMLITIFENIDMTDDAFYVVDNVIYYGQFIVPFIIVFVGLLRMKARHKKNLMFTAQMIKDHLVTEEKQRYEYTHEFLNYCPNCGAARQSTEAACMYCGASLVRNSAEAPR